MSKWHHIKADMVYDHYSGVLTIKIREKSLPWWHVWQIANGLPWGRDLSVYFHGKEACIACWWLVR